MASISRALWATSTSFLVLAALVRCSGFNADSGPSGDDASAGDAPFDSSLDDVVFVDPADAPDPDACVPLVVDDFERTQPSASPWNDSFGAASATIQPTTDGGEELIVGVLAGALDGQNGFVLIRYVPAQAGSVELDYDTKVAVGDDAGGPDGGEFWGANFPQLYVREAEAGVQLGTGVFGGSWLVSGGRTMDGDGGASTSSYKPIAPYSIGRVHLVARLGSAGGVTATIVDSLGSVESASVAFPTQPTSDPSGMRIGLGLITNGAAPQMVEAFAHVRACWRR